MPAYTTLADLKTYLGISGATDDALLNACIARASAAVDTYTGRTFYAATAEARSFDAVLDVTGNTLFVDDDLCAITSVVNGDATTITAAQYVTLPRRDPPYYALQLLASTGLFWTYTTDHENAITVTGYWAFAAQPPADVVQATVRWAGQMYRQKDAQVYDTLIPEMGIMTVPQGTPKDVVLLLNPYRRRIG